MESRVRNTILIILAVAVLAATVSGVLIYENQLNPKSSDNSVLSRVSFSFDPEDNLKKVSPWFSEQDGLYYVFLPSCSDLSALTVSLKNDQSFSLDGVDYKDGDILASPEVSAKLSVSSSLKDEKEKSRFIFIKTSGVASMFITTASGSMSKINADKKYYESGRISLSDASGSQGYTGIIDRIHGRGNTTWNYSDKKPYYFCLSEDIGLLGMNPGKSWVLLANHFDPSLIRNKLVYDFAKEHGVNYAVDSRFVDLYLNGEYAGLYQLCEKIGVGKNRVDIYNLESETQRVNPGFPEGAGTVSYPLGDSGKSASACQSLNNPSDISGGYLFEFFGDLDSPSIFYTDSIRPISIVSPEFASTEQVNYLYSYVQEFEDAITAESGVNPETGKHYTEYIDLNSFVLDYLINEVFLNYDGGMRSWFMYKLPSSQGGLIYSGPVWDFDASLGNNNDGIDAATFYVNRESQTDALSFGSWYYELYKQPDFYSAVVEVYRRVFVPYIENSLNKKIDELTNEIYSSAEMNDIRWFNTENFEASFTESTDVIRRFLANRMDFFNSAWIDGTEYLTIRIDTNNTYKDAFFSVKPGEIFSDFPEPVSPGNTFDGWYYYGTDERVNIENGIKVTQDLYICAKWIPDESVSSAPLTGIKKLISFIFSHLEYLIFVVAAAGMLLLLAIGIIHKRRSKKKRPIN